MQLYEHIHGSVDQGYNYPAASIFGSKPIRPTAITLPTRHKALKLMCLRVNFNTWATLQSGNKVALLTIIDDDFLKNNNGQPSPTLP